LAETNPPARDSGTLRASNPSKRRDTQRAVHQLEDGHGRAKTERATCFPVGDQDSGAQADLETG
jgi:hypothetical protein